MNNSAAHEPRYRADPTALAWRDWGDEVAVYDDGQARTHVLSAQAAEVLRLLMAAPLPAPDVAAHFLDVGGLPAPTEQEMSAVRGIIAELVRLGLADVVAA